MILNALIKEVVSAPIDISKSPLAEMNDVGLCKPLQEIDASTVMEAKHTPKDGSGGHWEGRRGNGHWVPDDDVQIPGRGSGNLEGKTWGEAKQEYEFEKIPFRDGYPDFSEISKGEVQVEPFTTNRADNFDLADIELAKQHDCTPEEVAQWRKDNKYTWHECEDMKTMQKVPGMVHNNIPHSGGIAQAKRSEGV